MSLAQLEPPPPARRANPGDDGPPASRGRIAVVVLLIVALLATALLRQVTFDTREARAPGSHTSRGNSLSRMDSYALALLLGGLRGPLVMFLWPTSENQKQEKDLDDFDTKIEWIRLLQAEFDTVHIFQIWNKAYNISVLRASLPNKYLTIIDALDYARSVDRERPDDINMIQAMGGIFFDKLGMSAEKAYFRRRVMAESLPHRSPQKLSRDDPAWRRLDLDPVLDENGNVLPDLLKPTLQPPLADPKDPSQNYDGSELQFLKKFEPFPKGVSPLAFGYAYFKRCQVLERNGIEPAQLSDRVIDSRPALALENWATEWNDDGRAAELRAYGVPLPDEREDMELPVAGLPVTVKPSSPEEAADALYDYRQADRISVAAIAEFANHLNVSPDDLYLYQSHQDGLRASQKLAAADADFLAGLSSEGAARSRLFEADAQEYVHAGNALAFVVLRYYISDSVAAKVFPKGVTRPDIASKIDESQFRTYLVTALQAESASRRMLDPDAIDYLRSLHRCEQRLNVLKQAGFGPGALMPPPPTSDGSIAH